MIGDTWLRGSPVRRVFTDCDEFSRAISRGHLDWNIKAIDRLNYRGSVTVREFGPAVFTEMEHAPLVASRRVGQINRKEDSLICLTLHATGSIAFDQGGREQLLQTNELLLWDGARPASVQSWETVECKTILIPRSLVHQHIGNIDDLTGQKVALDSGTGLLLKSHIETLHKSVDLIAPSDRLSVIRATLDLVGACFRPSEVLFAGTHHHRTLFRRIEELMRDMLFEPNLTPTNVAKAFGFTPRYLHRLFAETGMTFSQWVRNERLAKAKMALTNPSFAAESITQIAYRFGFCDAAYFSNAFKARYGKSPRAYRSAAVACVEPRHVPPCVERHAA